MTVAEHARRAAAIHGILDRVGVGALALGRLLPLAVLTGPACDLEGGHDALTGFQGLDFRPDRVDPAAEFMAEDVAFLHLDDGAVEEMEVGAADGGAGDFEDDILRFDDSGLGDLDWMVVSDCFGIIIGALGWCDGADVRSWTSFLPIQANAFMVSPDGSAYFSRSRAAFVMSCSVMALLPCPRAFSSSEAACDIAMVKSVRR